MEEMISKKKLLADLNGVKEVLAAQGDPFLANIIHRAIQCVKNQPVVMRMDLAEEGYHGSSVSGV